ncbi:hypothetical protein EJB05_06148, partial [Eragrostis curvula]
MGIINWMQSKFNGTAENRKFDGSSSHGVGIQESYKVMPEADKHLNAEQWPQTGFLSIGTLGNDEPPVLGEHRAGQEQDMPEFTVEEVKKLQDALARLLRRAKSKSSARGSAAGEDSQPLDRFLNCPSSLQVDRKAQTKNAEGDGDLSPDTKIILTKARDLLGNSSDNGIRKKSFKFLLKKMFVCHGGFTLTPSLKDPVESRMEKFFRRVIGNKINTRPGNGTEASRKYLEAGPKVKRQGNRRRGCEDEEGEDSCRWDRTDSECKSICYSLLISAANAKLFI